MQERPKLSCWHTALKEAGRSGMLRQWDKVQPIHRAASKQAALYSIGLCIAAQKPSSLLLVIFFT